ncbi:sorting nexin-4 [Magnaporthiopsis poae ATCC 64411]|uniref:Sorting nexin-4 n=1 Tax=Magnaporthiopsis poae (strain ATCC 64411 / 73-15) TaxID=644358 RepID=A0A0C4E3S9_MAGP6|nr:sorting nexin-4 [Magnaporthiopsis poae ATCC 64411]
MQNKAQLARIGWGLAPNFTGAPASPATVSRAFQSVPDAAFRPPTSSPAPSSKPAPPDQDPIPSSSKKEATEHHSVTTTTSSSSTTPPPRRRQKTSYSPKTRDHPGAGSIHGIYHRCACTDLRRSAILHTFLESPDWNATMLSRASRSVSLGSGGGDQSGLGPGSPDLSGGGGGNGANSMANSVFDNFADTFINAFTKVHKPDRRFIEVRERSDKLDEDLAHVEKLVARVARREADLESDQRDLAEQFQKLVVLEPGVESAVRAFAASVEDTASGLRGLREATEQDYLGSLRDLAAFSGALKNLLKAREQKQLDFEQLTEYLNKSRADRDVLASGGYGGYGGVGGAGGALAGAGGFIRSKIEDVRGVDHEQSRRERQRKLEMRIDELTLEVERAKRTSEMFDEEVVKEVANFERIKRVELKRQFGSLAQSHTDFYDATIDVWERYIREMDKDGAIAA